jgi:hypothetical protein
MFVNVCQRFILVQCPMLAHPPSVSVDVSEHFSYIDGHILLEKTDITLRKGVTVILAGFGPISR